MGEYSNMLSETISNHLTIYDYIILQLCNNTYLFHWCISTLNTPENFNDFIPSPYNK